MGNTPNWPLCIRLLLVVEYSVEGIALSFPPDSKVSVVRVDIPSTSKFPCPAPLNTCLQNSDSPSVKFIQQVKVIQIDCLLVCVLNQT